MGLSMEQRIVNPATRKWMDARAVRRTMVSKAISYQSDAAQPLLETRNVAARLWRAVRQSNSSAQSADAIISNWASTELGQRVDSYVKLAQFRFAIQQLSLGDRLLTPLTAAERESILALMPQPLPVETPVAMPEQELVSMFSGALRFLRLPLAYRT